MKQILQIGMKIHKQCPWGHWTSVNKGQWTPREGKQGEPHSIPSLLPGENWGNQEELCQLTLRRQTVVPTSRKENLRVHRLSGRVRRVRSTSAKCFSGLADKAWPQRVKRFPNNCVPEHFLVISSWMVLSPQHIVESSSSFLRINPLPGHTCRELVTLTEVRKCP